MLRRSIKNNTDIQSKWLSELLDKYPEINPQWLLTGRGDMINPRTSNSGETPPNIKERILQVADFLKIKRGDYVESLGSSYSNFRSKSKNSAPSAELIAEISSKNPEINIDWILTGHGKMLRDSPITTKKPESPNLPENTSIPKGSISIYDTKPLKEKGYSKENFSTFYMSWKDEENAKERKLLVRKALAMHAKLEETHQELLQDFLSVLNRNQ